MRLDDFDYHLPEELIAQEPLAERSASRLMVVERAGAGEPVHASFADIGDFLDDGDLLVVNRSRVVPARLFLERATGGRVEMLFVRATADGFLAWLRPMRRLKRGEVLTVTGTDCTFRFVGPAGERAARLELASDPSTGDVMAVLEAHGHVPLPPYIQRADREADRERYQTVFARESGSVAAPTAGLHFDDALLAGLAARGIEVRSVVLHVGPGTFSPLEHETIDDNRLDAEWFRLDAETVGAVSAARREGRRVVAVGTTATRVLESAHTRGWFDEPARDREGSTDLFIRPGYRFAVVGALVTNFHLPRSSLLLLVSALLGQERTLAVYKEAVRERYRFYSYGDAMLIR